MDFNELDEIMSRLDLETYLDSEGIDYKKTLGTRGAQLNLRECPACGGDKWKVYLNCETGLGNCFSGSCEVKFNKFKFVRFHTGFFGADLISHLKDFVAQYGWRPVRKSVEVKDTKSLTLPPCHELPINGKNLMYLQARGIDIEVAKYFHLKYCHEGYYTYEFDGKDRYMPFHKRVIIPIFSPEGELRSFQGRDVTGTADRKYLFPPGFAATGTEIFNSHNVRDTTRIIIGEGAFDVMALKIALDEDVETRDIVPVGTFGKHLSVSNPEHDQLAKFALFRERGVKEATLMWDSEPAAIKSALVAARQIESIGIKARIAILPKGKDPNEVPTHVVRDAYYKAMPLNAKTELTLLTQGIIS